MLGRMRRLADHPRPIRYRLEVDVDPERDRFRGEVRIELGISAPIRRIVLHAADLEIGAVSIRDSDGPVAVRRVTARAKHETLEIVLGRALAPGVSELRIPYEGPIRTDLRGLYLARSGERRYAATQLEAADARRFFPCFDEPAFKARFQISVTTRDRNSVISNAPIRRTRRNGRKKTVEFEETAQLSTYLIALVVGELRASRTRRSGETPIRVWHVPGKEGLSNFALEAAAESLSRLERYFGLPYPYRKLDLIAVPDFEFGAMENAGAVTFRESLLLCNPKQATLAEKKRMAEVIAHELAHMWFGDLVTMAWWDDLWLNEAFATWMAFTIVSDWKPEWNMWLDFEHGRAAAFSLDGLQNTHPIYTSVETPDQATENFDLITYEKGAAVVRMLERWLGPAAFRRGVRRYIRRHREGNARAADLWRALDQASGRRVAAVVRPWIEREGFPLLAVEQTDRAGRSELRLRQERFFSSPRVPDERRRQRWPIPVGVRVRRSRGRDRLETHLVTRTRTRIDLGPAGSVRWCYANALESGFYCPVHASDLLGRLGGEIDRLQPAERMGLIGHQWAGLRAGRAEVGDLLELAVACQHEPQAEVLDAWVGPLAGIEETVAPGAGAEGPERFRAWLGERFGAPFAELGWRPARREPDALRLRRAALLRIAGGIAEQPEILDAACEQLERYLLDRSALDANLAGSVVELAARVGDKARFDRYLETMHEAATPQERTRFLFALGAFRDPALCTRALELSLTDAVPTQDVVPLLGKLLQNRAAREPTWEFIQTRWPELSPRVPGGLASRLVAALPALAGRRYRSEVAAFFRAHPLPTAARALKQALERFDLDAELRRRAGPALEHWLASR